MPGPTLPVSIETYEAKYCEDGENFEKAITRVAKALRDDTPHYRAFREITMDMRFMPAGRIQSAMGATREVTAWNCLNGATEILTREFGAVPIERVAGTTVTLLDGNQNWTPCFIHCHGEQETVDLTFNGGFESVTIRSTLEHGWISKNKVLKTKLFDSPNGKREIDALYPQARVIDQEAYKRGIIHGLVYGDGHRNENDFAYRVCRDHSDIIPLLEGWPFSNPPSYDGDPCYYFTRTKLWADLKALPLEPSTSADYLRGFLRGWFAADGCVSTQPEATMCVGPEEEQWLRVWAPLCGWRPLGVTLLSPETNFGPRKKASRNLRIKKTSLSSEDFILSKHRERWGVCKKNGDGWRIVGGYANPRKELVYCPVVPTTHSFALACGVHSANCFVAPTIEDTFVDGDNSIMDVATKAAATLRQGGGIGYDFCLAPGTLITTAKRGCVPVEELQVGEELIGFAENFQLQKTVFEPAFVEGNGKIRRDSYLIETDKGQIVASADHLFVARTVDTPKKPGDGMRWIRTADLQPGNLIGYTIAPWQEQALSDSWLAGMFDGEGWATETNVGIAQNTGPVADRIRKELTGLGVDFREHQAADKLVSFVMRGKWQAYRLISMLAPTRVKWSVYGRKLCGSSSKPARILRIEHLGEQDVWATQTSTRTLIANGFLSHNSTLRPRNDIIRKLGSKSSGPIAFMEIFDAVCRTAASAGHRRGAQMGVLRVDHPDIETFIAAKQNSTYLTGFNLSIGITDEFMDALAAGKTFWLQFGGKRYREIDARELWDKIMRSTWDWAEPGVLFIDRMNEMNNLWYCEKIAATNPCVPGTTPILTDRGYVQIASVVDKPINVWNGKAFKEVIPRVTGYNQPMLDVILSDGSELTCTTAHKFILKDGTRIEAESLRVGDKLARCEWPVIEGEDTDDTDAYTQGLFSGDGWFKSATGGAYIGLYGAKRQLLAQIPAPVSINEYEINGGYDGTDLGAVRTFVYLGNDRMRAKNFVPGAQYSLSYRLKWLAGLIDADGYSTIDGCLQISSKDHTFLSDVRFMLHSLGVTGALSPMKDCWRLSISGSNSWRLYEVGLRTFRVAGLKRPQREASRGLTIVSVTTAPVCPVVYCFTEEDEHAGVFNGVYTAQCGEQPLPPNGACLLGSFNLARYVTKSKTLDLTQLIKDIPHVVRAMDNVIDRGFYPLPEQGREGRAKRRMGIGVTGVANAIEALGEKFAYGSRDFVACFDSFMETLRDEVYFASAMLAKEKGSFALFDRDRYLAGKFVASLGSDAREAIKRHGIRNSHLLSIAPTGTISLCADNISSGIEPVFAHQYDRTIRTMDGNKVETVQDYGLRTFGVKGKPCSEVTINEHLQVLLIAQTHVDSAVSKTCNIGDNVTFEQFKDVYVQAFEGGAKGCTTFRTSGKRMGILVEKKPEAEPAPVEEGAACRIDPVSGMKSCE
jgi:ribonucleoside-diphosphate reductase alpha chain